MLQRYKQFKIILLFFILFTNLSLANDDKKIDCNNYISTPNLFSKVNIKTLNSRLYNKNLLKILYHTQNNHWITDEYKKKYLASIEFKNEKTKCELKAKVRFHGDLKDHIKINDGEITSSIDLSLVSGNFFGRTGFKLYLPETRFNDSEIFITTLLRELKFLAPITFKTKIFFNQKQKEYLVQEKIEKEFLENQNMNEGFIFEADELFMVSESPVDFVRIENSNFLNRSDNHLRKGIELINLMNQVYFEKSVRNLKNKNYQSLNMSKIFGDNIDGYKNISIFSTLLVVLNAEHGLSPDDRKFYYNKYSENFEPIYYDGLSYNFLDLENSRNDFLMKSEKNNLPYEALINITDTKNLINSINIKNLQDKLNYLGLDLSLKQIENIFLEINFRLNHLIKINKDKYIYEALNPINDYEKYLNEVKKFDYFFVGGNEKNGFFICKNFKEDCQPITLNEDQISILLKQRLIIDKKRVIYTFDKIEDIYLTKNFEEKNYFKEKYKDFKITHNKDIKFEIDENYKEIKISQLSKNGKIIFYDGIIRDYKISFFGYKNSDFYDKNLITGCLTFYKIDFENTEINSFNSFFCEDAINIVNSSGTIKKIFSDKSKNDGIDFDFSDISIAEIIISETNNDCIDFSYGTYVIKKILASNCGDKAVSVGENSKVFIDDMQSKNSNYGVAVKDGAKTEINNIKIENTKTCLTAYNKKQEHAGGKIFVKNLECSKFVNLEQSDFLSNIKIANSTIQNQLNKDETIINQSSNINLYKEIELFNNDNTINVIIENPKGTRHKWKYSISNKRMEPDYFMGNKIITDVEYIFNYGVIPQTKFSISSGGNGGPLDVIVLSNRKLKTGDQINVKPIKIIKTYDDGSLNYKIVAVDSKNSDLNKKQIDYEIKLIISWLGKYMGNKRIKVDSTFEINDLYKFSIKVNKEFKKYLINEF